MGSTIDHIQLLANAYNQQRINTICICTTVFSSWTLFTAADDDFVEECMSIYHRWSDLSNPPLPTRSTDLSSISGNSMDDECDCGQYDSYHEDEDYGSDSGYGNEYHSCIYRGEYGYCTTPDSDEELTSMSTASCYHGPFSDLLSRLLPVTGTPVLINGQLVASTVSNDSSSNLSSLFLRDRSLSHHSILSTSSAYSYSDYVTYETIPTDDECEAFLQQSSTTLSSIEETEITEEMVTRMLNECDEMMKRIEKVMKNLKKIVEEK